MPARIPSRVLAAAVLATLGLASIRAIAQPAEAPTKTAPTTAASVRSEGAGRDTRHWAPPKFFAFDQMSLHCDLPDITKQQLACSCELQLTAVGQRSRLELDARNASMRITKVEVAGKTAAFTHEDDLLDIDLGSPTAPGDKLTVIITYDLVGNFPKSNGLVFAPASGDRTPLVFSQGETNYSSYWFPCRDEPDTKIGVTDITITPPPGLEALASGKLVETTDAGNERKHFHFRLDKPNAAYLTVIAVGSFEKKELIDPAGKIEMGVYRPKGSPGTFSTVFDKTPEMLAFYRERLGVDFAWPSYRQLQIKGFDWNGMENTTLTTLEIDIPDSDLEDTISHELFHHWFGDLVTCTTWDHVWLQEGWATYAEALWREHTSGQDGYNELVSQWLRQVSRRSRGSVPVNRPLVTNRWNTPDETFEGAEDPYTRGGFFLHTLRRRLGDDAFFRGTKLFLERFSYKNADTNDVRKAYEDASGDSLTRFFDQWLLRPGLPRLTVGGTWVDADKSLVLKVQQTQTIDSGNPAYRFDMPVEVTIGEDKRTLIVPVGAKEGEFRFVLSEQPKRIAVDPNLDVMAPIAIEGGELKIETPLRGRSRRNQ